MRLSWVCQSPTNTPIHTQKKTTTKFKEKFDHLPSSPRANSKRMTSFKRKSIKMNTSKQNYALVRLNKIILNYAIRMVSTSHEKIAAYAYY